MKKKILVAASLIALAPAVVFAKGDIKLWIHGNIVDSDFSPYI